MLCLKEKNNVIKTSIIIYSVNAILVYPQTALHQIKKPEAIPLQKTEEACFRFCPRCGNNPFHRLMANYLAKPDITGLTVMSGFACLRSNNPEFYSSLAVTSHPINVPHCYAIKIKPQLMKLLFVTTIAPLVN